MSNTHESHPCVVVGFDGSPSAHVALSRAIERVGDICWDTELIGGPAAKAIVDVADVRAADEIMLGTRGSGRVRALLGSVAHEVIHLAACPVTVIPERLVDGSIAEADAAATVA
jgi:hypothetical protein